MNDTQLTKEIDEYLKANPLWIEDFPIAASLLKRASEEIVNRTKIDSLEE